jgi:hypothetical protein
LYLSEGIVRSIARSCLIALLVVGLLDLPAMAANEKPLGMIVQAQSALLGNADATIGTTVFPGDNLSTSLGGTLRVKLGSGQLYLLSASAATLAQNSSVIHATVLHGTVGFSSTGADQLELEMPEGILRAADSQPAYGQVTIVGPQEVIISAYQGTLVLDNDGELHTIPAGKSYRVTMDLIADDQPQQEQGYPKETDVHRARRRRHLVWALVATGGVALASYFIWRHESESCYKPCKCATSGPTVTGGAVNASVNSRVRADGDCD